MSSAFKTICSPPDPPPHCPRARQLHADPMVAGGMADMGALLAGTSNSNNEAVIGRSDSCSNRTGVGLVAREMAAAITRGETRAEEEWNRQSNRRQGGGTKCSRSDGCERRQEGGTTTEQGERRGGGGDGAKEREGDGDTGREGSGQVAPPPSAMDGSSSMLLEWDAGCTNGAITTNYEVRGRTT